MLQSTKNGVQFAVKVSAGAKKTKLLGLHGNALKISIQSPPADGKANKELIAFLSGQLGVAKAKIHIVRGETSPHKILLVSGASLETVREKLSAVLCV